MGRRGQVLNHHDALGVLVRRFGQMLAVLHERHLEELGGDLDNHMGRARLVLVRDVEGSEAGLHHCGHLGDTGELFGRLGGSQ